MINYSEDLMAFGRDVYSTAQEMVDAGLCRRIWERDHSVWKESPDGIKDRLGWLDSPFNMAKSCQDILNFTEKIRSMQIKEIFLLGMGGSSLSAEVFSSLFGSEKAGLRLEIIDSVDPDFILYKTDSIDFKKSLFIAASKSGNTIETSSLLAHFYLHAKKVIGKGAPRHFCVITDPKSNLEKSAYSHGFLKIFLNDPHIGGRYSALSHFGLVPAALIGADIRKILEHAGRAASLSREGKDFSLRLGAAMGTLANKQVDKLTIITSPELSAAGPWIEQLVAESSGKDGKGILPVLHETEKEIQSWGEDRFFVFIESKESPLDKNLLKKIRSGWPSVHIRMDSALEIGALFFGWEMAIAIACSLMGINPFDQPDVESAKRFARLFLDNAGASDKRDDMEESPCIRATDAKKEGYLSSAFKDLLSKRQQGSYLALHAYIPHDQKNRELLLKIRRAFQKKYGITTTVGFGPRFLHSTGQLHKGDRGLGLFIQMISINSNDLAIPDLETGKGSKISFGTLKRAQATGDRKALMEGKRPVTCLELGSDVTSHLRLILSVLE